MVLFPGRHCQSEAGHRGWCQCAPSNVCGEHASISVSQYCHHCYRVLSDRCAFAQTWNGAILGSQEWLGPGHDRGDPLALLSQQSPNVGPLIQVLAG